MDQDENSRFGHLMKSGEEEDLVKPGEELKHEKSPSWVGTHKVRQSTEFGTDWGVCVPLHEGDTSLTHPVTSDLFFSDTMIRFKKIVAFLFSYKGGD